jgi:methylated-DNA-[protein]-cysteine S-methyltransferase
MNIRHTLADSALGELTLVAEGDALTGVYFEHHWYRPDVESLGPRVAADSDAVFVRACSQLAEYLCGVRTEFERRVWAILAAIPYGETVSYGEVAATLAEGTTAQEAGQAVGLELEEPVEAKEARLF